MNDLEQACDCLVAQAEVKFGVPNAGRCRKCGFRRQFHDPANHSYSAPVDPFVVALRGLCTAILALSEPPPEGEKPPGLSQTDAPEA